jgi:formylglycine-generating enzyme required for sulfatase activity
MQLYRASNGEEITLGSGSCLGIGGEARIFVVPAHPTLVAKVYHRRAGSCAAKLRAMLANPPSDPTIASGHVSIVWPSDLLLEHDAHGACVGFLMPRLTGMAPIIDFFHPRTRRSKCPLFNYLYLHRVGRNLAACFHALHEKGYVIGDVNESNILVKETAMVSLVDTDSFQIPDPDQGAVYRCPVGKPDYTPPELHGSPFDREDRCPEHDRFGLGVLLFQVLMEGTHPFAGVYRGRGEAPAIEERIAGGQFPFAKHWRAKILPPPAAPDFESLHPGLRALFLRTFNQGHRQPAQRASAAEWHRALTEAEQDLVICSANEQHRYASHLAGCPWCERIKRFGGVDAFPSAQAVHDGDHLRPAPAVQTPLPVLPGVVPVRTRSRLSPATWRVPSLAQTAWYQSSARLIRSAASAERWPWVALLALAAGWAFGWASGRWPIAAAIAASVLVLSIRAARRSASPKGVFSRPIVWCSLASLSALLWLWQVPTLDLDWLRSLQLSGGNTLAFSRRASRGKAALPSDRDLFVDAPAAPPSPVANTSPGSSAETSPLGDPAVSGAALVKVGQSSPSPRHLDGYRWTNSLGMAFVAVPNLTSAVVVSVWETRVQDFELFAKGTSAAWANRDGLSPTHPAVNLSWRAAVGFCEWLTARERASGVIREQERYRLPAGSEWAAAVGLVDDPYPWGVQWPAPEGAGNYHETRWQKSRGPAPVGSFLANEYGLFDLGGNVWEWCLDAPADAPHERLLLGGSYRTALKEAARLKHACGDALGLDKTANDVGFRVVLQKQAAPELASSLSPPNVPEWLPSPSADGRWANSLGMRFVPLPGSKVLMSIWETRVRDFAVFVRDHHADHAEPRFPQTMDHPVVNVSWLDAQVFCQWLTERERQEGRIGRPHHYRLPSDREWSRAVGLAGEEGAAPAERHDQRDRYGYAWGSRDERPPQNFGNYASWDNFKYTAPVGSFAPNGLGLYDLGGNAAEWCLDEMRQGRPVIRGASFGDPFDVARLDPLLSAYRGNDPKECRRETTGFRVVLDLEPER